MVVSHGGARLGSESMSQAFSSEPSLQSFSPLQKKASFNAVTISASQEIFLTQWFISEQKGFNFFFFGLGLTIFNRGLPITSLFLNVKG